MILESYFMACLNGRKCEMLESHLTVRFYIVRDKIQYVRIIRIYIVRDKNIRC